MNKKPFAALAGWVFVVIAALHATRILNAWHVEVNGFPVPMWVSWAAIAAAGYLAYVAFRVTR